jgi:hypothetical protein
VIGQGGTTAAGDVGQVLALLAARGLIASRLADAYAPRAISSS